VSAFDDECFECSEGDIGGCVCIADGCRDDCVVCWPIEVGEDQMAFEEPSFEEITQQAIRDDHRRDPGLQRETPM